MDHVTLQAVKRAMPGSGRARGNSQLLKDLKIEDQSEIVVTSNENKSLTLIIFADTLVEEGKIRINADDLLKLGISEGGEVTVRRKVPIEEQVRKVAEETVEKIQTGASEAGKSISDAAERLKESGAETAETISTKAKEVSEKVSKEVAPIGEKIEGAAREGSRKIKEIIPINRFNADIEAALKTLEPKDAESVREILSKSGSTPAVIPVHAATGRKIAEITIPPEASIAGVQRNDAFFPLDISMALESGDLVYITGTEKSLIYMAEVLEG